MSRYFNFTFVVCLWLAGLCFLIWGLGTQITVEICTEDPQKIQQSLKVYYKSDNESFSEKFSYSRPYSRTKTPNVVQCKFTLPNKTSMVRIDIESLGAITHINDISIYSFGQYLDAELISTHSVVATNQGFLVESNDPQFVYSIKKAQNIKFYQVLISSFVLTLVCGLVLCFILKKRISLPLPQNINIELSKKDTSFIKGLAIFFVLSHNFFHVIPPFPGENEMNFSAIRFWNVFYQIIDSNFSDSFRPVFSFFGFYAVYLFIFVSGYGLTKKMDKILSSNGDIQNVVEVVKVLYLGVLKQVFKIVKLSLIGVIAILIMRLVMYPGEIGLHNFLKNYLIFLTFSENFVPGHLFFFISSWWFLALIVQLYVLFPIFYFLQKKCHLLPAAIGVLCLYISTFFYEELLAKQISIFSTPGTNLIIFLSGMYFAEGNRINTNLLLLMLICLPLCWVLEEMFPLSFIFTTLLLMALYRSKFVKIFQQKHQLFTTLLCSFGSISMFSYILHTELRDYVAESILKQGNFSLFELHYSYLGYIGTVLIMSMLCFITVKNFSILLGGSKK